MDIDYLLLLQEFRNAIGGALDPFMEWVSYFVLSIGAYILFGGIYWCINKKVGFEMILTVSGGKVVSQAFKNTFCVSRPWIKDARIIPAGDAMRTATGYSFPSGHTHIATAIFGSIAIWQRKRKWLAAISIICMLFVMFSRNYLGVHTPQDVIVGFLLCVVCIFISKKIMKWADEKTNRDIFVLVIGLIISAVFIIYCEFKPYPIDYKADGSILVDPFNMITDCYEAVGAFVGFLIGWVLERHFIKFENAKNALTRLIRLVIGTITTYIIITLMSSPIILALGVHWGKFVFQILLFLWVIAVVPFLFNLAEKFLQNAKK